MTALDGVALVEGENGGNHWCAEEEEEEEQKDPQRGLLSGARAETAGQAHWDLYPTYSRPTPDLLPTYSRPTPDLLPTYSRRTPDELPT